jgi:branched-chain amino acid transport system substrate-binding protein
MSTTRRRYRRGVIAVAAAVTMVVAGCGGGDGSSGASSDGGSGGTVKIGAMLPLTGPLAIYGAPFRDAINLRVKEMGGEVAGKKIEVIFVDDASDLATGQTKAKQLVESDKVSMILGPLHSGVMAGLSPYLAQKKVPTIALLNHPAELGTENGWLFTPQGSMLAITHPMGLYAYDEMGVRSASVQASDYIAGKQMIGGFANGLKSRGGEIVQEQWAPLGTTDFGSYLSKLKPADTVASWYPGAQHNFMSQYFQAGASDKVVIPYGDLLTEDQLDELGPKMIGTKAAIDYTWRIDTPENKKFVDAYRQEYDRVPITTMDLGAYESISVALAALEATKGDTTPDKLREAILALELTTPAGPLRFDQKTGFGIRNIYIISAERIDGKLGWKPVQTYTGVGPETPAGE